LEVACPLFVPLAEEGMGDDEVTRILARRYLAPLQGVAALVLGCTHYPLLRPSISEAMRPTTILIESGPVLAEDLRMSVPAAPANHARTLHVCTTDVTVAFEKLAARVMAPEVVPPLERVVL
jgi:glutamate racemase